MEDPTPIALGWSPALVWALAAMGAYAINFTMLIFLGGRMKQWAGYLATLMAGIAFAFGLMAWLGFQTEAEFRWEWLPLGGDSLSLGLRLDLMSARMLAMVTGITLLVNLFSTAYMQHEKKAGPYWAFLSLFAFAMLVLVLAGDLLLMFMGWELVGFASWYLIGFWHRKEIAGRASQKAFVINRIGDLGFLVALLCLFSAHGNFAFEGMPGWMGTLAGFGLMAAAFGKSAQFPLQTWLPDAMAGPTPVSSLIHAATMVAAGVYLLLRCSAMFNPVHFEVLAFVGAGTALAAAISALTQTDIKRVLAYSTVSQLGLMVMGVGVGAGEFSFFHLLTHAFFKCGLFLSAGAVIHLLHEASHKQHIEFDAQDMRWMGGLGRKVPLLAACYAVFAAALAGLPLFSGFLSKDGLLVGAWEWAQVQGGAAWLVVIAAMVGSTLTAFYIARQGMLVFAGKNRLSMVNGKENLLQALPKLSWTMALPLVLLAGFSLWVFWSPSNPFHAASPLVDHTSHPISAPGWLPVLFSGLAIAGALAAVLIYRKGPAVANPNQWFFQLSFSHFHLDQFWHATIARATLRFSQSLAWIEIHVVDALVNLFARFIIRKEGKASLSMAADWSDRNVLDRFVTFLADSTLAWGARARSLQAGKLQVYLVYTLLAVLCLFLTIYYLTFAS